MLLIQTAGVVLRLASRIVTFGCLGSISVAGEKSIWRLQAALKSFHYLNVTGFLICLHVLIEMLLWKR